MGGRVAAVKLAQSLLERDTKATNSKSEEARLLSPTIVPARAIRQLLLDAYDKRSGQPDITSAFDASFAAQVPGIKKAALACAAGRAKTLLAHFKRCVPVLP